jgi:3-hydroxy-9,10-secoandrosta-1,3,5(10)-triene-9,17-dione monooxygenase reductase component
MPPAFDEREFRNALGTFATGVTVVTTRGEDGHAYGMTVNSFAAVSLAPPLVLWSLAHGSPSAAAFRSTVCFGISVLALEQLSLSRRFSRPGTDKFAGVPIDDGLGGVPLIRGAVATFECRSEYRYYGGDHEIIVGRVERYGYQQRDSLIFCGGRYQRGISLEPKADADAELSAAWSGLA